MGGDIPESNCSIRDDSSSRSVVRSFQSCLHEPHGGSGAHAHSCLCLCLSLVAADEGRALLVERDAAAAVADLEADADGGLDDPHEGEDGEGEGAPVDERGVALASEDGPERPGDGDARGEVALGRGERVSRSGGLEEEAGGGDVSSRQNVIPKMMTYKARKAKTSVQTPAGSTAALLPNASKAVRTTRTVVQPW